MKIIVCGCGKIGSAIIEKLSEEGHDVIAIDKDSSVVTEITNIHDAMGVVGNCADCETLSDAGVEEAELFIAVTGSDEMNMLSCFLAKRMGAAETIARIRTPEYNDDSLDFMKHELGLSMAINPELLAARELFDVLKLPSAAKVEAFARRAFEVVEIKLREESPLDGYALHELAEKFKSRVLVCMVQRGDEFYIPDGSFVLKSCDKIGIVASHSEITGFLTRTGLMQKSARRIMILGGSRTAFYLAKMLEGSGSTVKIIERDASVAEDFSISLSDATIIKGDGTEQELLLEEGLRSMDAFAALTGLDEQNILISIYAQTQKVPTVISKVNRPELSSLAEKLGVNSVISPKNVIADVLVQYARALENSKGSNVETMYNLMDGAAEALEFSVNSSSAVTEVPLKELKLKPSIIIAGIIRSRKTIVPGGNDMILPGDRVIVIAAGQKLHDLKDIAL